MTNFIGRSIEREEDIKLLQGDARFVDDAPFRKDTLHASFVRSPYPHAKILNINVSEAIKVNGVEVVLLGEDVKKWSKPFIVGVKQPMEHWCLGVDIAVSYTHLTLPTICSV